MAKLKYNESARHWAQSNEIVRTKAIRVGLKIIKVRGGRRNNERLDDLEEVPND